MIKSSTENKENVVDGIKKSFEWFGSNKLTVNYD